MAWWRCCPTSKAMRWSGSRSSRLCAAPTNREPGHHLLRASPELWKDAGKATSAAGGVRDGGGSGSWPGQPTKGHSSRDDPDRLVPVSVINDFLDTHSRLTRAREVTVFFGGAAIATLPALAVENTPAWLVLLLAGEALAAVVAAIMWWSRRGQIDRARQAMTGRNRLVATMEYAQVNVAPPPTTPEGSPTTTMGGEP